MLASIQAFSVGAVQSEGEKTEQSILSSYFEI